MDEGPNRDGQTLIEHMARNGLAVVGTFIQKRKGHDIKDKSGHR